MASDGVFTGTVLPKDGKQIIGRKDSSVKLDFLENSWQ